jgi:uncharacterized Zn finger protein
MLIPIRIIEAMTNATWLSCKNGVHRLHCKACGEIHYAKFTMSKGEIVAMLVESNEIPDIEYTGESIPIASVYHDAIRAAFEQ